MGSEKWGEIEEVEGEIAGGVEGEKVGEKASEKEAGWAWREVEE